MIYILYVYVLYMYVYVYMYIYILVAVLFPPHRSYILLVLLWMAEVICRLIVRNAVNHNYSRMGPQSVKRI